MSRKFHFFGNHSRLRRFPLFKWICLIEATHNQSLVRTHTHTHRENATKAAANELRPKLHHAQTKPQPSFVKSRKCHSIARDSRDDGGRIIDLCLNFLLLCPPLALLSPILASGICAVPDFRAPEMANVARLQQSRLPRHQLIASGTHYERESAKCSNVHLDFYRGIRASLHFCVAAHCRGVCPISDMVLDIGCDRLIHET